MAGPLMTPSSPYRVAPACRGCGPSCSFRLSFAAAVKFEGDFRPRPAEREHRLDVSDTTGCGVGDADHDVGRFSLVVFERPSDSQRFVLGVFEMSPAAIRFRRVNGVHVIHRPTLRGLAYRAENCQVAVMRSALATPLRLIPLSDGFTHRAET